MKKFFDRIFSVDFWADVVSVALKTLAAALVSYGVNAALRKDSKV